MTMQRRSFMQLLGAVATAPMIREMPVKTTPAVGSWIPQAPEYLFYTYHVPTTDKMVARIHCAVGAEEYGLELPNVEYHGDEVTAHRMLLRCMNETMRRNKLPVLKTWDRHMSMQRQEAMKAMVHHE